jgi:hypothetical protein
MEPRPGDAQDPAEHAERDQSGVENSATQGQSADREWADIVQRLGNDVFSDVPDIIATPVHTPPESTQGPIAAGDFEFTNWDDDDHFVQPVPPAPSLTRPTRLAWLCASAGIALLITASVASFADTWSTVLGSSLTATGAFMLFRQIPAHRDDPDDDGAVV